MVIRQPKMFAKASRPGTPRGVAHINESECLLCERPPAIGAKTSRPQDLTAELRPCGYDLAKPLANGWPALPVAAHCDDGRRWRAAVALGFCPRSHVR